MSYTFYKILHLSAVIILFFSLGLTALQAMQGGPAKFPQKKFIMVLHGLSMFFVLLGGFGLLARLGLTGGFPAWVWGKLVVWLLLGASVTALLRFQKWKWAVISLILALGVIAVALANLKMGL